MPPRLGKDTNFRDTRTTAYPWPRNDTHTSGIHELQCIPGQGKTHTHTLQGYMNYSVSLAKERHTHTSGIHELQCIPGQGKTHTHTSGIHELQCIPGQGKTHTSGIHELQCIPGQGKTHTHTSGIHELQCIPGQGKTHTHTSGIHELQCIPGHFSQHVGGQGPSTDGRTRGTLPSLTTGTDCVGDMAPRPEVRHNLVCTSGATWQLVFGSNMQNMPEIPVKWTRQSAEVPYDRHQQIKPVSLYITPDRLGFFPRSGWRAGWEGRGGGGY